MPVKRSISFGCGILLKAALTSIAESNLEPLRLSRTAWQSSMGICAHAIRALASAKFGASLYVFPADPDYPSPTNTTLDMNVGIFSFIFTSLNTPSCT